MKKLMFTALCVCGLNAFSAVQANPVAASAPEKPQEDAAARRERFLTRSGGMIPNKKNAKGSIVIVDAQKLVKPDYVRARVQRLEDQLWFHVNYVAAKGPVSLENADAAARLGGGTVTVVLSEAGSMPAIINVPESRVCFLNVSALAKDAPDQAKLETRVAKELSRSTAFALGIPYSQNPGGLMSPYTSLTEIDGVLVDMLSSDLAINSDYQAGAFGMTRFSKTSYRKACEEGWAPEPKNDYQKAIWKEFHEIPSNPIVIKSDKAK